MTITIVRQTISVFIGSFTTPPTWKLAENVRKCLSTNFDGYDIELKCGTKSLRTYSVVACAHFTLTRAGIALSQQVNASYGVSVVPFHGNSHTVKSAAPTGLYMAVRNRWHKEYLFFGAEIGDRATLHTLGDGAYRALEGRRCMESVPDAEEKRMALLCAAVAESVNLVFKRAPTVRVQ